MNNLIKSQRQVKPQNQEILQFLKQRNPDCVEQNKYLQKIECPACGRHDAYVFNDNPYLIHCSHKNSCGAKSKTLEVYPELRKQHSTYQPKTHLKMLAQFFLREDLRRSGLDENPNLFQAYTDTSGNYGYSIHFPNAPNFFRLRLHPSSPWSKKNQAKYKTPYGAKNEIFDIGQIIGEQYCSAEGKAYPVGTTLFITEGEKKALKFLQETGQPCVALVGNYGWAEHQSEEEKMRREVKKLLPSLLSVLRCKNVAQVVIVWDNDANLNFHFANASADFAKALSRMNIPASFCNLPFELSDPEKKYGLDDYLLEYGSGDVLEYIQEQSHSLEGLSAKTIFQQWLSHYSHWPFEARQLLQDQLNQKWQKQVVENQKFRQKQGLPPKTKEEYQLEQFFVSNLDALFPDLSKLKSYSLPSDQYVSDLLKHSSDDVFREGEINACYAPTGSGKGRWMEFLEQQGFGVIHVDVLRSLVKQSFHRMQDFGNPSIHYTSKHVTKQLEKGCRHLFTCLPSFNLTKAECDEFIEFMVQCKQKIVVMFDEVHEVAEQLFPRNNKGPTNYFHALSVCQKLQEEGILGGIVTTTATPTHPTEVFLQRLSDDLQMPLHAFNIKKEKSKIPAKVVLYSSKEKEFLPYVMQQIQETPREETIVVISQSRQAMHQLVEMMTRSSQELLQELEVVLSEEDQQALQEKNEALLQREDINFVTAKTDEHYNPTKKIIIGSPSLATGVSFEQKVSKFILCFNEKISKIHSFEQTLARLRNDKGQNQDCQIEIFLQERKKETDLPLFHKQKEYRQEQQTMLCKYNQYLQDEDVDFNDELSDFGKEHREFLLRDSGGNRKLDDDFLKISSFQKAESSYIFALGLPEIFRYFQRNPERLSGVRIDSIASLCSPESSDFVQEVEDKLDLVKKNEIRVNQAIEPCATFHEAKEYSDNLTSAGYEYSAEERHQMEVALLKFGLMYSGVDLENIVQSTSNLKQQLKKHAQSSASQSIFYMAKHHDLSEKDCKRALAGRLKYRDLHFSELIKMSYELIALHEQIKGLEEEEKKSEIEYYFERELRQSSVQAIFGFKKFANGFQGALNQEYKKRINQYKKILLKEELGDLNQGFNHWILLDLFSFVEHRFDPDIYQSLQNHIFQSPHAFLLDTHLKAYSCSKISIGNSKNERSKNSELDLENHSRERIHLAKKQKEQTAEEFYEKTAELSVKFDEYYTRTNHSAGKVVDRTAFFDLQQQIALQIERLQEHGWFLEDPKGFACLQTMIDLRQLPLNPLQCLSDVCKEILQQALYSGHLLTKVVDPEKIKQELEDHFSLNSWLRGRYSVSLYNQNLMIHQTQFYYF